MRATIIDKKIYRIGTTPIMLVAKITQNKWRYRPHGYKISQLHKL